MKGIVEAKQKKYTGKEELIEKLKELKGKLLIAKEDMKKLSDNEEKIYKILKNRVKFLQSLEEVDLFGDSPEADTKLRELFLMLLIDYLIRKECE